MQLLMGASVQRDIGQQTPEQAAAAFAEAYFIAWISVAGPLVGLQVPHHLIPELRDRS